MENTKLPLALAAAMAVQIAGGAWWVAQQAATIEDLENTVSQLGSRMAIEENVNLRRDVQENARVLSAVWQEFDDVWQDVNGISNSVMRITDLQQRLALLQAEFGYIKRDHEGR